MRFSQSNYRLFHDCSHAFYLSQVLCEPQIVPDSWREGTMRHEGLRRYAEVCFRGGKRPVKRDAEAMQEISLGYESQGVRDSLLWFAREVAWDWGDYSVWSECPVEQALSATLPCGETFSGKLDLVTCLRIPGAEDPFGDSDEEGVVEKYLIVDWKSRVPDRLLRDGIPLQLRAYAWLLCQSLGKVVPVTATYIEITPPHMRAGNTQQHVWEITPNDIANTEKELDAWVLRVKGMLEEGAEAFEPQPGAPCPDCHVVAACRYSQTKTVQEYSAMQPAERAARWGALAGLRKQLEPMVKEDSGGTYLWDEKRGVKSKSPLEFCAFAEDHGAACRSDLSLPPMKVQAALDKLSGEDQAAAFEQGLGEATTSREFVLASEATNPAACQEKTAPRKAAPEKGKATRLKLERLVMPLEPLPDPEAAPATITDAPDTGAEFLLTPEQVGAKDTLDIDVPTANDIRSRLKGR